MRKSGLLFLCLPLTIQAEEFSFDISGYEKPSYEFGGFIEPSATHSELNTNSTLYNLQLANTNPVTNNNLYSAGLQLEGLYRFTNSQINFQYFVESQDSDISENQQESLFHELYYTSNHLNNITIDLGKRVQKWGKGYAWNPTGFIERKKDPNDPELSREGYVMLTADYVRSYDHDLKTLAVMPVVLPVTKEINNDFSSEKDTGFATKIYLLYRDTDIDLMFLSKGGSEARFGFDFSSNITTSFEIHGEFAYINNKTINLLNNQNQLVQQKKDVTQSLLGFRYLTTNDITWIGEYYHNGTGYTEDQLKSYFILAESDFQASPPLLSLAQQAKNSDYGNINPGRDYLYLSVVKKEPYDFVYFNMGINSIINLQDQSYSLTPELIYTGFNNIEMRLRLTVLQGKTYSEFGEKLNEQKIEFRYRYYF